MVDPAALAKLLDLPVGKVEAAWANLEKRRLVKQRLDEAASTNRIAERGMRWLTLATSWLPTNPIRYVRPQMGAV